MAGVSGVQRRQRGEEERRMAGESGVQRRQGGEEERRMARREFTYVWRGSGMGHQEEEEQPPLPFAAAQRNGKARQGNVLAHVKKITLK